MAITVKALNVYPVKGLRGIALAEAMCTDRGLEHDRRWMVVDESHRFVSQREVPRMATIWTDIVEDSLVLSAPDLAEVAVPLYPPDGPTLRVQVWNSTCDALAASDGEADAWLSDFLGFACRLVYMPDESERFSNPAYAGQGKRVGFADGYAYLVIGEASLSDLNARLSAKGASPLPMNRFRPNIVVAGAPAYAEDHWKDVAIGEAVLRGVKPCGRCQVTTTDQATGEVRGPEPLATLATYRESAEFGVMFGMNCVAGREGFVALGDAVEPVPA